MKVSPTFTPGATTQQQVVINQIIRNGMRHYCQTAQPSYFDILHFQLPANLCGEVLFDSGLLTNDFQKMQCYHGLIPRANLGTHYQLHVATVRLIITFYSAANPTIYLLLYRQKLEILDVLRIP